MFQDYEGIPEDFISESWISEDIWELINSDVDLDIFEAFISWRGMSYSLSETISDMEEAYHGEWDSEEDFAENLFDECYLRDVPKDVMYYIDYKKFARDLFMGDYYYSDGYVFACY